MDAEGVPYAWSARCMLSGVVFSAGGRGEIELIVEAGGGRVVAGELQVVPFLRGAVKDRWS